MEGLFSFCGMAVAADQGYNVFASRPAGPNGRSAKSSA